MSQDYLKKQDEVRNNHKAKLEKKHKLEGHPKADKLYNLAWEMEHSSGLDEVEYQYDNMAELLDNSSWSWTAPHVTKWLDEYFAQRPQLQQPEKGMLGYIIPTSLSHAMEHIVRNRI
ncbi:MAG: hypothetical protein ACOCUL_01535 [Bacteroidota bacterium]